jgi:hypothetical protein
VPTGYQISRRALVSASLIGFAGQLARTDPVPAKHVILLGDSVFDNARYVGGSPDVQRQVADLLPQGLQLTLLARDGALIADIAPQIEHLPRTATHIVISAGGNDALQISGILDERATSVANAWRCLQRLLACLAETNGARCASNGTKDACKSF